MLVSDVLTNTLYIKHKNQYCEFNAEYWSSYYGDGILNQVVEELLEKGVTITPVYNVWELPWKEAENKSTSACCTSKEWKLAIRYDDPEINNPTIPTIVVYGLPGLSPTAKEREEVVAAWKAKQDEWAKKKLELEDVKQQEAATLEAAMLNIVGATVVKYVAPTYGDEEDEYDTSGYLVVRTIKGELIHVTSTHSVWDYGDKSSDSIWCRIAKPEEITPVTQPPLPHTHIELNFKLQVSYAPFTSSYTITPVLETITGNQEGVRIGPCWFNLSLLTGYDNTADRLAFLLKDKLTEEPHKFDEVEVSVIK